MVEPRHQQKIPRHCNAARSDSHQQGVTRLKILKMDLMGITHLSSDGILLSLAADRKVLSAQGLCKTSLVSDLDNHVQS